MEEYYDVHKTASFHMIQVSVIFPSHFPLLMALRKITELGLGACRDILGCSLASDHVGGGNDDPARIYARPRHAPAETRPSHDLCTPT